MSRIAESKHIYFGTVDALSSWSCRPAGDTFDLYFTFLFVANDGKRDRRSGRTHLVAKVLRRGNALGVHGRDHIAGLPSCLSKVTMTSSLFRPAFAAALFGSTARIRTPRSGWSATRTPIHPASCPKEGVATTNKIMKNLTLNIRTPPIG